jgi:nitroreductase
MHAITAPHDCGHERESDQVAPDYVALVHAATRAASSHNTQPWTFRREASGVIILPDLSRRCPAVDPDDHHLYASLGCAAENLLLAAQAAGWRGHPAYEASEHGLHVALERTTPISSALFEAIPRRQCTRAEYDGSALSTAELDLLAAAGGSESTSVVLLTSAQHKEQVAEYVAAGNLAQFADPAWRDELKAWIRFNARDAMRTGDGLYGPAMGNPDVPRWLGRLFMRVGFSAERQNRKDVRLIQSSSAIAVFVSEGDDPRHWIEAGRCYERFALQATALDLRTAFINQPVEVAALRRQFADFIGTGGRRPDLVVRVGRGPEMPRSHRRPVEQVLV